MKRDVGVIGDVALQAGGVALQDAAVNGRAAGVGVRARERHVPGAVLGQASRAGHAARVRAIGGLIERDIGIIGDTPCRLVVVPISEPADDRRAPAVGVGARERHGPRCRSIGKVAGAADVAGIRAVGGLIEGDVGVVGDVALQAGGGAGQRTGRDRRAAAVAVGAREGHGASAIYRQVAGAADVAGVSAIGGLVEGHVGVIGDGALQAVVVPVSDAGRDRRATRVSVGTRERHGAGAVFGQRAGAGHAAGVRAVSGLIERDVGVIGDGALQTGGGAVSEPAETVVPPLYVLVPESVTVPVPVLGEAARAGHRAGVGAVGGLIEGDVGVVGDVALQASGGAHAASRP